MNVLFLATLSPTSSTLLGRTIPLARAVARSGHAARIITLGHRDASRGGDIPIDVVGPALRGAVADRPSLPAALRRLWEGKRALTRALMECACDAVVLVKPHPQNTLAVRDISTPILLDADDDERWASRLSLLEHVGMSIVERHAARRARAVTVCSPALVERYTNELHAGRVELVPTGIAPSIAPTPDLRSRFSLSSSAPLLLHIGSIAISSGHRVDHVLAVWDELAARAPDLHFVLIGDGIDERAMRAVAAKLVSGNRVHFFGRFAPEEAEGFARQATLLVDPVDDSPAAAAKSSSRTLLALRTGVPIIAGASGVRALFLPSSLHASFLYRPGGAAQLLDALSRGLAKEAREHFQQETAGRWEQWSWERLGKQFVRIVEEAAQ